ncbi:MAG TPA: triphosphoribosyl-dephospho-CoA synthase [Vicinamibacterales bacterium]|nr:triphosphoribosyl-dephospho-CoA synthase [Vicinamibacterales bacterium]
MSAAAALDISAMVQLACLLEVSAPKPGNVCPGRHFSDARYEDFLASAAAIGAPLAGAGARPLGATIRLAIEATASWTASNTNLGLVLMLAPLARAAALESTSHEPRARSRLRDSLRRVLAATTVADARDVYAAIRRASPGGLGQIDEQDVSGEPTVTLVEAMRLAADRDSIAREYATAYETTFLAGAPALERARADDLEWDDAIVETFLTLLAAREDTHIARREGTSLARDVTCGAHDVLAAGGVRTAAGRRALGDFDRRLRDERHRANPGTTADLTAASVFVVLAGGGWARGSGGRHAAGG